MFEQTKSSVAPSLSASSSSPVSPSMLTVKADVVRGEFHLDIYVQLALSGVTAIFGKSGSGKSSLLRLIAGLDKEPKTEVSFGDEIWQSASRKGDINTQNSQAVWLSAHKRGIGYVFQQPSLFEHLSVQGNLDYAEKRAHKESSVGQTKTNVLSKENVLCSLGVDSLLEQRAGSLSGGQKQRVAIARALLSNPQLLILDEPVSALDQRAKDEVLSVIQWVHQYIDIPILYVSHSLSEVAQLADQMVLIKEGRLVAQGELAKMLLHPEIALDSEMPLETIIDARVVEIDHHYGLCRLAFSGGNLWLNNKEKSVGHLARARIMARDVSMALEKPKGSSIQNILPASIKAIRYLTGEQPMTFSQAIVELDVNGFSLLAQITRRSIDQLDLKVGKQVFAQIKSVALLG